MKSLYLVRHAKSSWNHSGLDDFDRPLNERGMHDAPEMGKYLAKSGVLPDTIVTSPARRARQTAEALAHGIDMPIADISEDERIYAASVSTLIAVIQSWDDTWERTMMVGHNPGMAELVALLTGADVEHVPTCTVMEIKLDVASWLDVSPKRGILISKLTPEGIKSYD